MNHSVYTADKATHLKAVVVFVLLTSIAIVTITLAARLTHPEVNAQKIKTQTVHLTRSGNALIEIAQSERRPI